jgi:hypothetical protein
MVMKKIAISSFLNRALVSVRSAPREITLLSLSFLLVLAAIIAVWFTQPPQSPPPQAIAEQSIASPTVPLPITSTPFLPGLPSLTPSLTPSLPPTSTPTPPPTQAPSPTAAAVAKHAAPTLQLWGINFSDTSNRVTIQITPRDKKVNRGQPIQISFYPGETCSFGDHHGCVNAFLTQGGAPLVFISVHSGVGGEGQALRHAFEGTGLNQAAYSLAQIHTNLAALAGSAVTITQGDTVIRDLVLAVNGRVPAQTLESYFNTPMDQALAKAAAIDAQLKPASASAEPELVIETCGWKAREEPWAQGVTSTSASIYLGVIRKAQ